MTVNEVPTEARTEQTYDSNLEIIARTTQQSLLLGGCGFLGRHPLFCLCECGIRGRESPEGEGETKRRAGEEGKGEQDAQSIRHSANFRGRPNQPQVRRLPFQVAAHMITADGDHHGDRIGDRGVVSWSPHLVTAVGGEYLCSCLRPSPLSPPSRPLPAFDVLSNMRLFLAQVLLTAAFAMSTYGQTITTTNG